MIQALSLQEEYGSTITKTMVVLLSSTQNNKLTTNEVNHSIVRSDEFVLLLLGDDLVL